MIFRNVDLDFYAIYKSKKYLEDGINSSFPLFLKFKLIYNFVQFIETTIYSGILITKSVSFVSWNEILKVYFSIID